MPKQKAEVQEHIEDEKIMQEEQQEIETPKIIFVSGPELARRLGKSFPTIINWWNQGRIVEDAFLNEETPNAAIYKEETVANLIEELRKNEKYHKEKRPIVKRKMPDQDEEEI